MGLELLGLLLLGLLMGLELLGLLLLGLLMGLELMGLSMRAGRGRGLGGAREIGGEKQSPASVRPGKPREGENEPHEDVDREGRETGRRKAGDGQQPERGPAPPGASQGAEQDDAAADDK
jgi:predicted lipid-binding transport protein (Tim44 family)